MATSLSDLDFRYPEELVAKVPSRPTRVMWVGEGAAPLELTLSDLFARFEPGDLVVINETRVERRRIFGTIERTGEKIEILFVTDLGGRTQWEVLCPASRLKYSEVVRLPSGLEFKLLKRGLPQQAEVSRPLTEHYFEEFGDVPLPPYIQKARGQREGRLEDKTWYQTEWARFAGSSAAPTASLHFHNDDFEKLSERGVNVAKLTLHVGLGTFLPIAVENLGEHQMHAETVVIPAATWAQVLETQKSGGRIWAVGTTVTRALESAAHGLLALQANGDFTGESRLFIRDDFEWRVVCGLLTNFHQPQTTLLALVASFAGLEKVKSSYAWAIERKFRLFSYGDLSVWVGPKGPRKNARA